MDIFQHVKLVCGVLLMLAFFLPMSRCHYYQPIDLHETQAPAVETTEGTERLHWDVYAYREFNARELRSWVMLLAFSWPLAVFALGMAKPKLSKQMLPIEPLACIGSGSVLVPLLDADEILFGGWLAVSALVIYFFTTLVQFTISTRRQYLATPRGPREP